MDLMERPPLQAIVFDFGNVVGFFDHNRTLDRLAKHTNLSREEMYRLVYDSDLEDEFESGRIPHDRFLIEVKRLWLLGCEDCVLEEAIADIFQPNPEICDLIPSLRGRYRLLLGSNTNPIHSKKFRTQFADVLGHLDHVVLSHSIGVRKPMPGFFEHCVELADCPASECLFVDDLAANIEGARACGLQGLLYRPGAIDWRSLLLDSADRRPGNDGTIRRAIPTNGQAEPPVSI